MAGRNAVYSGDGSCITADRCFLRKKLDEANSNPLSRIMLYKARLYAPAEFLRGRKIIDPPGELPPSPAQTALPLAAPPQALPPPPPSPTHPHSTKEVKERHQRCMSCACCADGADGWCGFARMR